MNKFVLILFVAMAASAFAADTAVKGYLVDTACATEDGKKPGFGAKHSRGCLNMEECAQSGYGVLTADQQYIKFDKAGDATAKEFISHLTKRNDIQVVVTGSVDGSKMTVSKIELQ